MMMQRFFRVVLVLAVVLGVGHQAYGQTNPKPRGPLGVKAKQLAHRVKPPHSVLVEGHAFRTDGYKIFWREVTYVFGANDTTGNGSEFDVIPFTVPTTSTTIPSTEVYVRPVLMEGFVYARAKKSPALQESMLEVRDRIDLVENFLESSRALSNSLDSNPDFEEFIGGLRQPQIVAEYLTRQSRFLESELDRSRVDMDRLARMPEITRELMLAQKKSGFGLFRLIMGIVIDGGVDGTDIVMYIEPGTHDFDDGEGDVPVSLVHIVLTEGEFAEIFETKAAPSPDKTLHYNPKASSNTNYIRYAIRKTGSKTPAKVIGPTDFCEFTHNAANNSEYVCEVVKLACDVYNETANDRIKAVFPCTDCDLDED